MKIFRVKYVHNNRSREIVKFNSKKEALDFLTSCKGGVYVENLNSGAKVDVLVEEEKYNDLEIDSISVLNKLQTVAI